MGRNGLEFVTHSYSIEGSAEMAWKKILSCLILALVMNKEK